MRGVESALHERPRSKHAAYARCPKRPHRPVLKHGPRSPACLQVSGWQARVRSESKRSAQLRPEGRGPFAQEQAGWDPKDGELCLGRTKPEETLVEVRRASDVQIDRQTWA
jgi:hypothetical protein